MDYDQILIQLFVGTHPRSVEDIDYLRLKSDITAVLNLQTDDDMQFLDVDWTQLQAHYAASGIVLRRLPVRDFDSLHLQQRLPECVNALDELLRGRHAVYLHCTAGVNRSASVAVAYLHWCRGWDLKTADAHVQRQRRCSPDLEAVRLASLTI